ncbi:MAG: glucoamylase family protein [Gemmatimonadota bacterium]
MIPDHSSRKRRVNPAGRSGDAESSLLAAIQEQAFQYFVHETNLRNGLVADTTSGHAPASIAAVGLALTSYPVAVERGLISRAEAAERTLTTLRFFWRSKQGPEPDATGYRGFYYHFLDMTTGARTWECELSTVDSALLLGGMLAAAAYFDEHRPAEREIRELADQLYARVDWRWAQNDGATVTHGWKPESGFLPYRWKGYDEALLLYVLGLGSPIHPLPAESYRAWAASYDWRTVYDIPFLYAGPLFTHQLSHIWIDFRGIQDAFMRDHGSDYFENSRRATAVQQQYAIRNPSGYVGYGESCWGITASDGPGDLVREVDGITRRFFGYRARGVPDGPDDGTIAPWGVVASLPFAPELVLPAIANLRRLGGGHRYGFRTTFNQTFPDAGGSPAGWVSPFHCGLNQGPIVVMIENYDSGLVWQLMRGSPYVAAGLRAAGFTGGWLTQSVTQERP